MHLPENYRVVVNGNRQYKVQRKGWFGWRDFKYEWCEYYDGGHYIAPEYNTKELACRKALEKLEAEKKNREYYVKSKQWTDAGPC